MGVLLLPLSKLLDEGIVGADDLALGFHLLKSFLIGDAPVLDEVSQDEGD